MTTIDPAQKVVLGPSRTPTAAEQADYEARERNHSFFLDNQWELFDRHPRHWLLIYGEQTVEAFEDPLECIDRRDALDEDDRATVWIGHPPRSGIWIL
ncbi:MAG: hypothetical protein F4Y69_02265 [Chloroflexi bacterium]|nr:hypothetical protein [Chloroflexota bacterium]MYF23633.1 hypothetical protein [Chloroflexota bacterium]